MRMIRPWVLVSALLAVTLLPACAPSSDLSAGSAPGSHTPEGDTPVSSPGASGDPAPDRGAATRGTVTGTVRTATGSPVAGAGVQPRSLDTPARAIPELLVATDQRGDYRWTLDPGRYEFTIEPGDNAPQPGRTAPRPVTVVAGQAATLDFTLS